MSRLRKRTSEELALRRDAANEAKDQRLREEIYEEDNRERKRERHEGSSKKKKQHSLEKSLLELEDDNWENVTTSSLQ
jgi:hypothetical protein